MAGPKKLHLQPVFLTYAWLLLTTGVILISMAGFHFYNLSQKKQLTEQQDSSIASASDLESLERLEGNVNGVQTIIQSDDARGVIVAKFLERHNSPMEPYDYYGTRLVEIADEYDLDFRLLPAIAMQESNLCRNTHSGAPHNCLGFGIHERGTLDFNSYEEGFERAAKELRAYYIDQGRITTEQVMQKYTPGSNGSWADSVDQWMAEMRYDDRVLGRELKENTNVLEFAQ